MTSEPFPASRLEQHDFKEVYTQVPVTMAHATFRETNRLEERTRFRLMRPFCDASHIPH